MAKKTELTEQVEKTLNIANGDDLKEKISDVEIIGNPDSFQLLCKASSKNQGWMKSTKALEVEKRGCFIQVSTQQKNSDGSYAVAEALTYAPGFKVVADINNGKKLEPIHV